MNANLDIEPIPIHPQLGGGDRNNKYKMKNNMKEELFVQLMEQQKQMDVVKKALDLLYYRQREILKQVVEEMETPETVGSINMFLKVSEIKDGSSFPEKYDSPSSLYKYLNEKKGNTEV
jgi:hypothetical protein